MHSHLRPIYCVGGANIDYMFTAKAELQRGTSNPVTSQTYYGGVARNVAENLSHWTSDVYLHTVVGSDPAGRRMLQTLQQAGVNIDHCLTLDSEHTAQYYAVLEATGELDIAYADMKIYDRIPKTAFLKACEPWKKQTIIFIDTNLPADIIAELIQRQKQNDAWICIDPVSVQKASKLPTNLDAVFLMKPNQYELAALTGMTIQNKKDCENAGRQLLQRGVKNIVISLGEAGYVIVNDEIISHHHAQPIKRLLDVNGAGDAFFAGLLFGLQQNTTLTDACEMGAIAAAHTIQSPYTVSPNITFTHIKQEQPDAILL